VDSLGNYSSRHELYLVTSELEKGQQTQQRTNMKCDEHADAHQN
jgi:hypothetical protein